MTARQYIELVQQALTGIPTINESQTHEEYVRLYVALAYNQVICELAAKNYSELDLFCKFYKNILVELDSDTNIYFSKIPVNISPLPNVKSGVRLVAPVDSNISYVPMNREKLSIYSGLEVSTVSTRIGYTVGKNDSGLLTVDYFGMTSDTNPTVVKMYLLIPFEVYKDTDIINIPGGQDQVILNLVLKLMGQSPQADLKNSASEIKY